MFMPGYASVSTRFSKNVKAGGRRFVTTSRVTPEPSAAGPRTPCEPDVAGPPPFKRSVARTSRTHPSLPAGFSATLPDFPAVVERHEKPHRLDFAFHNSLMHFALRQVSIDKSLSRHTCCDTTGRQQGETETNRLGGR